MLVLRRDQLDALAEPLRRRHAAELTRDLRERHPARTRELSDEGLHALIRSAFAVGARYGIEAFADVSILAELLLLRGEGFDRASEPHELTEILDHPEIPGGAKAAWLKEALLEGGAVADERTDA